jgi:poly(A) polymerase
MKVVHRLDEAGYQAHLVGGCVRDLLLGKNPKDFDVATDATPEQVKSLFRNSRIVGRRFRIAHVIFGREVIEVATFRGQQGGDRTQSQEGRLLRDNVFGSMEEDAFRRDFTVNALYYDASHHGIVDYVDAIHDIHHHKLRLIGDPETRYREDPVRMIRAARFAAKLDFKIEESTEAPVFELGELLEDIPAARLFDEVLKLFQSGHGVASLHQLERLGLLQYLLPMTYGSLQHGNGEYWRAFLEQALINTDKRLSTGKSINPAFMYAVLLWPPMREYMMEMEWKGLADGSPSVSQIQAAATEVLERQCLYTAIPRRFTNQMREIWTLQPRLEYYGGKRAQSLIEQSRFRAAYDFLLLRETVGEETGERAAWWTDVQEQDESGQLSMFEQLPNRGPKPNKRRRRR